MHFRKAIFCLLFIQILLFQSSFSKTSSLTIASHDSTKKIRISFGYGFYSFIKPVIYNELGEITKYNNLDNQKNEFKLRQTGPFNLSAEFTFLKRMTLGISLNYEQYEYNVLDSAKVLFMMTKTVSYSILPRFGYYFYSGRIIDL